MTLQIKEIASTTRNKLLYFTLNRMVKRALACRHKEIYHSFKYKQVLGQTIEEKPQECIPVCAIRCLKNHEYCKGEISTQL